MEFKKPKFKEFNLSIPHNVLENEVDLDIIDSIRRNITEIKNEEIEEKDAKLKQMEQDLLDLNDIINSFKELVFEQSEMLDEVDSSINATVDNVDEGLEDLKIADEYQSKAMKRTVTVLGGASVGGALLGGVGSLLGTIPGLIGGGVGTGAGAAAGLKIT